MINIKKKTSKQTINQSVTWQSFWAPLLHRKLHVESKNNATKGSSTIPLTSRPNQPPNIGGNRKASARGSMSRGPSSIGSSSHSRSIKSLILYGIFFVSSKVPFFSLGLISCEVFIKAKHTLIYMHHAFDPKLILHTRTLSTIP